MGNALDLESLTKEFRFVELGRQVAELISQHPHVEVIRLRSAIAPLEAQLARQDRELCQLAEANERARAEQDSQLEGLHMIQVPTCGITGTVGRQLSSHLTCNYHKTHAAHVQIEHVPNFAQFKALLGVHCHRTSCVNTCKHDET
jgi:hypothetical protein